MIWLAEITGADRVTGVETVFRFGTSGYNHPTAMGYYEPRLLQPALFRRDVFKDGRTGGGSRVGWGEMVLANADGGLDYLDGHAFDGRAMRLLAIEGDDAPYGTATVVLSGTMEQAVIGLAEVAIRIRDRQAELDKPVQTVLFGGTNVAPDGVDGTPDDIKGQPHPDCWGECANVEPVLVNLPRSVYQVNSAAIEDVLAVTDAGVAITRGVARASVAELLANAPAASSYDYCLGGGSEGAYIRLGTPASGRVTADLRGHKPAGAWLSTAAQIIRDIVTGRGGLAAGDLVEADFAALDAAAPWTLGLWVAEESHTPELLDALCASVAAWWGFDRLGRIRLSRVLAPTGNPVVTFKRFGPGETALATDADIIDLAVTPTSDGGRGVPVWQVRVGYARSWAVQDAAEVAVSASARGAFTAQEWRWATASDPAVKAIHPGAGVMEVATLLADEADAQALAELLLGLHGVPRRLLRLTARVSPFLAEQIDLGAEVAVELPRLGMDAGKGFRVVGLRYDLALQIIEADLWG